MNIALLRPFLAALILFCALSCYGQVVDLALIDSLKKELNSVHTDTLRVRIYTDLAFAYHRVNPDSALHFTDLGYELAKTSKNKIGEARSLATFMIIYYIKADYDQALSYYDLAKAKYMKLGDTIGLSRIENVRAIIHEVRGEFSEAIKTYYRILKQYKKQNQEVSISVAYNNLGSAYQSMGEYDSALSYFYKTMELKSKFGDVKGLASTYNNIGNLKVVLKEYESAEKFLLKALEVKQEMKDLKGLGLTYENIGTLKLNQGQHEEAKHNYKNAFNNYNRINDKLGISNINNLIGAIEIESKNYNAALELLKESLIQKREIGHKVGEAKVLRNIAKCYFELGQRFESKRYAKKSLKIAQKIGAKSESKNALEFLHEISLKNNNMKEAFEYLSLHSIYKDSLYNEQKAATISRVESKFALEQIQSKNQLLQKEQTIYTNQLEQSKLQIKNQSAILVALFISVVFAILTAIFWYMYTQKKHRTISLLQELNDEIVAQKGKIESQADELMKAHKEVQSTNQTLENLVKERAEKIQVQNKKLRDYAFANSHEVRAPLANLLGLANISALKNISEEEFHMIYEKICESAFELDKVITNVNKLLKEEDME